MVFGGGIEKPEVIINVRGNVKDAEKNFKKLSKSFNKLKSTVISSTGAMTKTYTSNLKGMAKATKTVTTGMAQRFNMAALSIMFGGMN